MGLLDRIRGVGDRPSPSTSSGVTVRPTPARTDSELPPTPSRGDAWTMPGLKTTLRPMPTIVEPPASMLVTRRPTAVVKPEVRHGVDLRVSGEVLSGVTARATGPAPEAPLSVRTTPKSKKSRAAAPDVSLPDAPEPTGPTFTPSPQVERTESRTTDFSPTPVTPRSTSPRPTGQMPSIKDVRSAISLKAPEPEAPKRPSFLDVRDDIDDGTETSRVGRRMKWDDIVAAAEPPPEPTPEPSPNRRRGNAPPISFGAVAEPAARSSASPSTPPPVAPTPASNDEAWPTAPAISPTAGRANSLPDLSAFGIIPGVTTGKGAAFTPSAPASAPRPAASAAPRTPTPASTPDSPPPLRARRSRGAIAPEPSPASDSSTSTTSTPANPSSPSATSTPATSAPQLRSRDADPVSSLPAGHTADDGHDHGALHDGDGAGAGAGAGAASRPLASAEPLLRGRESGPSNADTSGTPARADLVTHSVPDAVPADSSTRVDLAHDIRSHIEGEVGSSPSSVEVRQGPSADRKAREFNAEAFTDGGVVHLAADRPLSSARGRQLLAHEATHVVQQASGTKASRDKLEQQARQVESSAGGPAAPGRPSVSRASTSTPAPVGAPALSSRTSSPTAPALGVASNTNSGASAPTAHVTVPSPAPRAVPSLVGSHSEVTPTQSAGIPKDMSTPAPSSASGTQFGDTNRVTVPSAASVAPTSLKVAQQPTAVAAAVATQVAREAIGATPAAGGPLLRPRTNDIELDDRGGNLPEGRGEQETSFNEPTPKARPSTPAPSPARNSGRAGGGHDDEFGEEEADCTCSGEIRDTAHDRAWLETHAHALYPFIRAEIRSELLRDRERRGRLMREQR